MGLGGALMNNDVGMKKKRIDKMDRRQQYGT
jgi:hypothetical protein